MTGQSSAAASTPQPAEKPKLSDEVLLQYFTSTSPFSIDSSTIAEYLAHVEKILDSEVPADIQTINSLCISLFKLLGIRDWVQLD